MADNKSMKVNPQDPATAGRSVEFMRGADHSNPHSVKVIYANKPRHTQLIPGPPKINDDIKDSKGES